MSTAPNTPAVIAAIVGYLTALTYPDTTSVYTLAQEEEIKDVTDLVATGGACVEVYGTSDDSQRHNFGGRVWDEQSWLLMSLVSKATPDLAKQIYKVRDALVQPFQVHATLGGGITQLFHAQIKPGTGAYIDVLSADSRKVIDHVV
jgi:hypothetical protein